MVEEDPEFFSATVWINGDRVHDRGMEWRAATLSHKIAEHLQDQEATKL